MEVTDLIEAFDQEEELDLHITDSYVTGGSKICSLSSLPSNKSSTPAATADEPKQGDVTGSLSSLPSNKSLNPAATADEPKQGDVTGNLACLPSNKKPVSEVAEDDQMQGANLVVESIVRGVSECLVKDALEQ